MSKQKCAACGGRNGGVLHEHHIDGRHVSNETVTLCPNCHYFNHAKLLLIDNAASRAAIEEMGQHKNLSAEQYAAILQKHGYKPFFDGEEEFLLGQ